MVLVKGLSVHDIKKMPSLGCILAFTGVGCAVAAWYLGRLILKDTDGSFNRGGNPLPYLNVKHNQRTKFWSPINYTKIESPAGKPSLD